MKLSVGHEIRQAENSTILFFFFAVFEELSRNQDHIRLPGHTIPIQVLLNFEYSAWSFKINILFDIMINSMSIVFSIFD